MDNYLTYVHSFIHSFILYFLLMEIHIKHSNNNNQVSAGFVHSEENKQIIAEFLSINAIR